jgi:hypothetical protein
MKRILVLLFLILGGYLFSQNSIVLIEFKYKNITVETKELPNGKIEKTIKDYGQNELNLQLRDLIIFKLIEEKYSAIKTAEDRYDFSVILHSLPMSGVSNICDYSISVEIYDKNKILIERKLIRGQTKFRDFAEDLSSEIVKFITNTIK